MDKDEVLDHFGNIFRGEDLQVAVGLFEELIQEYIEEFGDDDDGYDPVEIEDIADAVKAVGQMRRKLGLQKD
jgi:hypothetical protein